MRKIFFLFFLVSIQLDAQIIDSLTYKLGVEKIIFEDSTSLVLETKNIRGDLFYLIVDPYPSIEIKENNWYVFDFVDKVDCFNGIYNLTIKYKDLILWRSEEDICLFPYWCYSVRKIIR